MANNNPKDLIKASDARQIIGVSHAKMSQLIKDGVVRHYSDPLDKRVKLVSRSEIAALRPVLSEAA